jgi:hypothetical protein
MIEVYAYRILIEKLEKMRLLGRPRYTQRNDIKVYHKQIRCAGSLKISTRL